MTGKSQLASTAVAVSLALALNAAGASAQQAATTQVSPHATEPLPAQGAGQAAQGAAVTGPRRLGQRVGARPRNRRRSTTRRNNGACC